LEAYLCPAKVLTIGYGTTKGVKQGMKITQEQAEEMLKNDMQIFTSAVLGMVGDICNEYQVASLISFSYNLGVNALQKSTLLKVVKQNPQNLTAIEREFMKWVNAGGKKLEGLVKRRAEEFELYAGRK
jgi:lysozyme